MVLGVWGSKKQNRDSRYKAALLGHWLLGKGTKEIQWKNETVLAFLGFNVGDKIEL